MAKFIKVKKFPTLHGFVDVRNGHFDEMEDKYYEFFDYTIITDSRLGDLDVEDIVTYFSSLPDRTVYWGKMGEYFYFTFYSPKELLGVLENIVAAYEK